MNRFVPSFLLLCCLFFYSRVLYATHAAGGELLYELISGATDTYRFTFKFYRDCGPGSVNAPDSVRMCYVNQCGAQAQWIMLRKVQGALPDGRPNGTPVGTGCIAFPTTCAGGTLPGYQEWWYTADLTLTQACDNWRFWISIAARNHAISNLSNPGNQNIYIEAMFNNTVSPQNSSPSFTNAPIPYCCINNLFTYNNGAVDADGDSLVFESVRPRSGSQNNQNCNALPVEIPYTNAAYNPLDNPFATSNSFTLDPSTGALSFIPSIQQVVVITVKVNEYRNGQLIGYVIRDIQIVVIPCNTALTSLSIDTGSVSGGVFRNDLFHVMSCAGKELRFCFDIKSLSAVAELVPSDNHDLALPGSTLTYTNVYTDSIRGCVVWPTTPAHAGLHTLTVSVKDSGCLPPGFIIPVTYTIPVMITPYHPVFDTISHAICAGSSYLGYAAAGTYVDTLMSSSGCDSIRTLELSVNPVFDHARADTACSGRLPYRFGGQLLTAPGIFTEMFQSVTGCDSAVTLAFAVVHPTDTVISAQICRGAFYEGYSVPGVYQDIFINTVGCDSTRTINLSFYPYADTVIHHDICHDESFLGYNLPGIYQDTFPNALYGCDSIRTIHLTVHPVETETLSRTICPGDAFLGYTQTGTYTDTIMSAAGCDSIRILHLNVSPVLYQTVDTALCDGVLYGGYGVSGTYTDTFVSSFLCDSIRTLHLVVHRLKDTVIRMEVCSGETFLGYSASGNYADVFTSYSGCDSTRYLELKVHPFYYTDTLVYICEGDAYHVGGALQHQAGTYRDSFLTVNGCDSVISTELRRTPRLFPDLGPDREICADEALALFPGTYRHYLWNTGETAARIYVNTTGRYLVTVYDFEGCAATDTIEIYVHELPEVRIQYGEGDVCISDTLHLSAAGNLLFRWYQDGEMAGTDNRYSVIPQEDRSAIQIALEGTDAMGCSARDSMSFYPVSCCGTMYVPNAFTPDGDGLNDQFRVMTTAFFKEFQLVIMDRWGNRVFESADIRHGWNGVHINMPADPGVYFYMIKARCYKNNKSMMLRGDLTLIR